MDVPLTTSLSQNYPNPFNPATNIRYDIPFDTHVIIKVYDVLGREVKTLMDEFVKAGSHEIVFDGRGLATGIYFYRLDSGRGTSVKKMVLLK